jgi:transposase
VERRCLGTVGFTIGTPSKPSMGKSIRNLTAVTRVGLDLVKRVFQVHAVEAKGEIVVARKLTRSQLIQFFAELPPCVVAMEACSSAHHWGRALIELGHEVRLIPPAHVKPYVRRNKSDQVDAAAICKAMSRPGQRFVTVPSIDNQADLMRHRTRELLAGQRTAALNALRGHLAEIGVVAPQGAQHAYDLKRLVIDGFDANGQALVPDCVRVALRPLVGQIDALDEAIGGHCQSKFYTACSRSMAGWTSTVLLTNHQRAWLDSMPKIAYTYLP